MDPSREDPRDHIRFRGAAVKRRQPAAGNIAGVGLRRSGLEEARKERLDVFELLQTIVEQDDKVEREKLEKAKAKLAFTSPRSQNSVPWYRISLTLRRCIIRNARTLLFFV